MLLLLLALLPCLACGGNGEPIVSPADGGDAIGDRRASDKEVRLQPPNCATARTVCSGLDVLSCEGGVPRDIVKTCDQACSLGRCTNSACAEAERTDGTRGCRFYGTQMDNVDEDDEQNLMLLLSNAASTPVMASVEIRVGDDAWTTLTSAVVRERGSSRVELKRPVLDAGLIRAGAFRVETDGPVLAVQIISDDSGRASHSSGGTVLRPAQAIGRRYVAVTYPTSGTAVVFGTAGSRGGAGTIIVIATEPMTHVQLALTSPALIDGGVTFDPASSAYEAPVMNEGDVLQIFSSLPGGDLTGSRITSDVPVAVFSGNIFTTYGYDLVGAQGGDMALEQLPPTSSWSGTYVGARLSPQSTCSPFFGAGAAFWTVVAADDGANVTLSPAEGVSMDGLGASTDLTFHLDGGGSQSFSTRGNSAATPADFVVTSADPILLAQWFDCEPALSWGIDGRLSGQDLSFALPPGFDHELVVVRQAGTQVTLDGRLVPNQRFRAALPARGYEVARLGAADLGSCEDMWDRCDHMLSGGGFGVSWRGMDVVCSYAVTVPSGDGCALPNAICTQ